jgi:hypothetical protein
MEDSKLITYPLKVEKEKWKTFKGTSYILGFDTVNDCLEHLIEDCVKRVKNGG